MKKILSFLFVSVALLITTTCFAGPPNAGQLLQEQKRPKTLPGHLQAPEEKQPEQKEQKPGVQFAVKSFTFQGFEGLISEEELQAVVADAVGKELTFPQLQAKVAEVTRHLKEQGWLLARAYLPQQDVSAGMITIAIIQGKSDGNVRIEGDQSLRINPDRLQRMAKNSVKEGEPFHTAGVERTVLLMNDIPGITAKGALSPGTAPGTTTLTIKASEEPLLTGALWADNYGNRYTGAIRGNGLAQLNDPFHVGDQFKILLTGAQDLKTGELAYTFPVGTTGLHSHICFSYLKYELGEEYENLDGDGDANTWEAGLHYPLLRSRKHSIYTELNVEYKRLSDAFKDIDYSRKKITSVGLDFNGDHYDALGGAGLTSWNASATYGNMDEEIATIDHTDTQGDYTYFQVGLSRLQRLIGDLTLYAAWQGQFSLKNLTSSEQFSLGGPYGVRAYPVGEGLGDEGHLFNLEIKYALPVPEQYGALTWSVFYDAGHITLHKDPWENSIVTATGKNHYWLQGAGTGLEYNYDQRIIARLFWAHTIDDNDGRSIYGKNSDGKDDEHRFWAQVVWRF